MPDANKNFALNAITGAAFGAAGQRCMALSVCTFASAYSYHISDQSITYIIQ
jgi:malonate-semialdehyde dehydrogenase (acetylating)/methylmalonate-semialdehyde dehydrogenase